MVERECQDDSDAGFIPSADRIRYFLGRHLTERDFTDEQLFHRSRLNAHQWMQHGWGIVFGLEVTLDEKLKTSPILRVSPGAAVDPYGRTLFVKQELCVPIAKLKVDGDKFLLVLSHRGQLIEKCPVIIEPPCPTTNRHDPDWEYGRVRESVELLAIPWKDGPTSCWPVDADGCRVECPEPSSGTFEPPMPCGKPVVPLALVSKKEGGKYELEFEGRRYLPGPLHSQTLTHITGVNWKHDGELLVPDLQGKLVVRLDRAIQPPPAWGKTTTAKKPPLVPQIFQVHKTVYEQGEWLTSPIVPKQIVWNGDQKQIEFEFDPRRLTHHCELLQVRVSLHCDFLLDEDGRAVDGNHLGGRVASIRDTYDPKCGYKTGDGVAGGTFESWFTLQPHEYARPTTIDIEEELT